MGTPRDAEDRVKGLGEGADGHVQSEGCDTLKQGSGLFWEAGQGQECTWVGPGWQVLDMNRGTHLSPIAFITFFFL